MRTRICLLSIILNLLFLNMGHAQQSSYVFRHIGVTEGLPDNYVKSVFPIPDGRIGIRSTVLLSLYDGANYSNFPFNLRGEYPISYNHIIPEQYVDTDNHLWMKERGSLRVFDLTTEQYIYNVDSLLLRFGLKDQLADLFIDSEKHYWFLTSGSAVYMYDKEMKELELICRNDEFMEYYGGLLGVETHGKHSWMVHQKGVIRCYDLEKKRFIDQVNFLEGHLKPDDRVILRILENGDFWIMWDRGVGYYDVYNKKWNPISNIQLGHYSWLTSMDVDKGGNAWVGSVMNGVHVIDMHNFSISRILDMPLLSGKTIRNDIHSIYCDRDNNAVWIGLFNQGICYFHPSMNKLMLYNKKNVAGDWNGEEVRCILETTKGEIWMGTVQGLYRYDPQSQTMNSLYKELKNKICRTLYEDSKQRIWVGTYHDGLYCIDQGKVRAFAYPNTDYQNELDYSNIRIMTEDPSGRLWVSIYGGVGLLNPENGEISLLSEQFPKLKKYKVANALAIDNQSRLVVGSDNGLYIYDPAKNTIWTPEEDGQTSSIFNRGSIKYNQILKDHEGTMWFATQYGLNVLTHDNQSYTLGKEEGLSSAILSIVEDRNHDMWISTITSIYKVKVERKSGGYKFHVISYLSEAEIRQDDLFSFASLATRNNQLFFSLINGFISFFPENMVDNQCVNRPLITSFRLFNVPVLPGEEFNGRVLFNKALGYSDKVLLDYDENFITLEFSGLNFPNPSQTSFRYRLEGLDREWTETLFESGQGRVTYNNLSPGEYIFRVSAAGNDRVWGPESAFAVSIHPPFWDTLMARIFYVILCCLAVFGLVYFVNRRNHLRMIRMQQQEALKQKEELDQMKFRFFTNISHELRTPLTLIITPLDMMIHRMTDESVKKQLGTIYKNAQNLLSLVNQLLDFRKLEMKGERLHLMNGDMEEFIASAYNNFVPMAAERHLNFENHTLHKALYMYFDRDKVHKIVNNLLSNAFKYTPAGGTVKLILSTEELEQRNYVRIEVTDTGIGISESDLPYIFDRFYQVGNLGDEKMGSGIGLHLVKEYVTIHEGKITVNSQIDCGTSFIVWLPMDLKPEVEEIPGEVVEESRQVDKMVATSLSDDNRKKLLLVEDNKEFRTFLKEQLEDFYQIVEAADGEEGEKCAIDENPDLIISDIMMPKVDGIELCRRIKTNVQTSHIPVILLTARTADDIKINSYEVGADSYMAKPFNFDMLMVRIEKLIEQQEKRKQEFRKNIEVNPSAITITSVDEQLIQKSLEYLEKNMDNPEYGVEELSRDLGMVRMSLYRKIQSITGNTPTDFIRSIRLKRAAQLLQGSQLPIIEVANRVGFSSPSYFSKCFKETFGMLPKQYVEEYEKKESKNEHSDNINC